ncbi:(S)-ureidoglycine aminohydrolase, partial [Arthrobacter sp.]|uniref:(S)-ureidoglycine aminohydrolase n=1 Tax=Arthrobacter sp. TaxID=1667 RepID=UPI00258D20F3
MGKYYSPAGGLPPQTHLTTERAIVTEAYTVIPKGVMTDIVTSSLPGFTNSRAWIIARPISGFATTFSQLIVEIGPGGGAPRAEFEAGVEGVIFVTQGKVNLTLEGELHELEEGGYAYLAAGDIWGLENVSDGAATFQWIRKAYERLEGYEAKSFVTSDAEVEPTAMPDTDGAWKTTRFTDSSDLAHDMQVNIVTFQPGGVIPFPETHVMEHGLYVLEGKAMYLLNN